MKHSKDPQELKEEYKEIGERNIVEGKFGNAKRALGLGRIMAKLEETAGNMVTMDIFILNMETYLRRKFSCTQKSIVGYWTYILKLFSTICYSVVEV